MDMCARQPRDETSYLTVPVDQMLQLDLNEKGDGRWEGTITWQKTEKQKNRK